MKKISGCCLDERQSRKENKTLEEMNKEKKFGKVCIIKDKNTDVSR